jgi:hypothetical protein
MSEEESVCNCDEMIARLARCYEDENLRSRARQILLSTGFTEENISEENITNLCKLLTEFMLESSIQENKRNDVVRMTLELLKSNRGTDAGLLAPIGMQLNHNREAYEKAIKAVNGTPLDQLLSDETGISSNSSNSSNEDWPDLIGDES